MNDYVMSENRDFVAIFSIYDQSGAIQSGIADI